MEKLEFRGSRYELQQAVKKLNGVMDADNRFHCIQKIQNVSRPSGISFRFDCTVSEAASGFAIGYRVRPTAGTLFLPMMLLLILVCCVIAATFYKESWLYSGIFTIFNIISSVILLVCRQKCTHHFLRAFEKHIAKKKRF